MKFYERHYANSYEELITYYPRFYRDVYEMVEILKAQGEIADALEANIEQTYLNNFILTADLATVKVWESILDIANTEKLTLDQRKQVIIGRLGGYGHIGEPEIREIIALYTERDVMVDFALGVIYIVIEGEVFDETNLLDTLLHRIPAHLALDMRVHVERAFRQTLNVGYAGAAGAFFKTMPVGEDRTASSCVSVAHGGRMDTRQTGIPLEVKNASASRTEATGGIFYHTHTKSKLIG